MAYDTTRVGSVCRVGFRNLATLQGNAGNLGACDGAEEHVADVCDGIHLTVERTGIGNGYGADGSPGCAFQVDGSRQASVQVRIA